MEAVVTTELYKYAHRSLGISTKNPECSIVPLIFWDQHSHALAIHAIKGGLVANGSSQPTGCVGAVPHARMESYERLNLRNEEEYVGVCTQTPLPESAGATQLKLNEALRKDVGLAKTLKRLNGCWLMGINDGIRKGSSKNFVEARGELSKRQSLGILNHG